MITKKIEIETENNKNKYKIKNIKNIYKQHQQLKQLFFIITN